MKRCIGLFLYCWLLIILFTSCIYEDYSGCPQKDSRKMVRINVDWHLFDKPQIRNRPHKMTQRSKR